MFINFFGFSFEKAATLDNLYNSYFTILYSSFKKVIAENRSVFLKMMVLLHKKI